MRRYDLQRHGDYDIYCSLDEMEDGDWIRYADHEAAMQKSKELLRKVSSNVCADPYLIDEVDAFLRGIE